MLPDGMELTWQMRSWVEWDGYLCALISLIICIATAKSRWFPTAAVIFAIGVIIASIRISLSGDTFDFSITKLHTVIPTKSDWKTGFISGAIPQVPTTLLNSCIAVCKLSEGLYPTRNTGLSLRSVSTSIGVLNSTFCWFGGFPTCHGSGGLAGQHRFGARTNLSIIVLGFGKLILGIFLGTGLLGLLNLFPKGMLAALLSVASWELSVSGRDGLKGTVDEARICVITAALVTFYGQAVGIILGVVFAYISMFSDMYFGKPEQIDAAVKRYDVGKEKFYMIQVHPHLFLLIPPIHSIVSLVDAPLSFLPT